MWLVLTDWLYYYLVYSMIIIDCKKLILKVTLTKAFLEVFENVVRTSLFNKRFHV